MSCRCHLGPSVFSPTVVSPPLSLPSGYLVSTLFLQPYSYKALPWAKCLLILANDSLWHPSPKGAAEAESLLRSKGKDEKEEF